MMRRQTPKPLGELLNEYIKELRLQPKLKEVQVVNQWEKIVGKAIAQATSDIYIRDKKLYVRLYSSIVRNELYMIRDGLLQRINEEAGEPIVDEIILR